jgi:hypothetical protein
LGVQAVAAEAGELIQAAALAVKTVSNYSNHLNGPKLYSRIEPAAVGVPDRRASVRTSALCGQRCG